MFLKVIIGKNALFATNALNAFVVNHALWFQDTVYNGCNDLTIVSPITNDTTIITF